MTAIESTRGSKLVVKVEDVADSGVFTVFCTVNAARGIVFNAGTKEEKAIDCADLDAVAWLDREKDTLSASVNGAGQSHKSDKKRMFAWFIGKESKRCKVILDDDDAANVITFTGNFHLTTFDVTGEVGAKVQSSLALESDGEIVPTYGANVGGA